MTNDICVLDRRPGTLQGARSPRQRRLGSTRSLLAAMGHPSQRQVWILQSKRRIAELIKAMSIGSPRLRRARLISYERPERPDALVLESAFGRSLLGAGTMVGFDELKEILGTRRPEDFCIAAEWHEPTRTLALWRGDLSVVVAPIAAFPTRGGTAPDPSRLAIEDCGQTIRLGRYEASVDSVLYERDPVYRRRAVRRMRAEEKTLGASIRRLRKERGLLRTDFPGLDEKTLARIERGEVKAPHRSTLDAVAKRLGIPTEELGRH